MQLFNKTIEEMDFLFIKSLVDRKVPENYYIEYKGHGYLYNKKNNEDIEKDKKNLAPRIRAKRSPVTAVPSSPRSVTHSNIVKPIASAFPIRPRNAFVMSDQRTKSTF
jgi:hypothetical protein